MIIMIKKKLFVPAITPFSRIFSPPCHFLIIIKTVCSFTDRLRGTCKRIPPVYPEAVTLPHVPHAAGRRLMNGDDDDDDDDDDVDDPRTGAGLCDRVPIC